MKRLSFLSGLILALFSLSSLPQVQAASPGELFSRLLDSPQMYYQSQAQLQMNQGGEWDSPFDLMLEVYEEGGKQGEQISGTGSLSLEMTNLQEMPAEWGPVRQIKAYVNFDEIYDNGGNTTFFRFRNFALRSDNEQVQKMMDLFNELAKFPANTWMRLSMDEMVESLRALGVSTGEMADGEGSLGFFTMNRSLEELSGAFGRLADEMIRSGVLKTEVINGDSALRRARGNNDLVHRITMGDQIDEAGARIFQQALTDFLSEAFPLMADEIRAGLLNESSTTIMNDLNELLNMVSPTSFRLLLSESSGMLTEVNVMVDLQSLDVPFRFEQSMVVEYAYGFALDLPSDAAQVVDLNRVIEGIATFASGVFQPYDTEPFSDYDFGEYNEEIYGNGEMELQPLEEEPQPVYGFDPKREFDRIIDRCDGDLDCLHDLLGSYSDELKAEYNTGFMSNREYRFYREQVWKALHP